jgi:hypothetical protein
MFQDVEQIATLNVEDDVLESDAPLFPSFASSQAKYFTPGRTSASTLQCARQCAQTRSEDRQSAANANQATNEKRA